MGALLGNIVRIAIQLLAGVGIGAAMDKVAADKLPAYPVGGVTPVYDSDGKINIMKIVYFVAAGVIGALVWKFVARKLKIKL